MAEIKLKNQTTPDTPSSGRTTVYVDSTTKKLKSKDDAGVETDYGSADGGNAATTDALDSATTVVNVSSATAPTTGQVLTATSSTAATWQTPAGGGSGSGTPVTIPSTTPDAADFSANEIQYYITEDSAALNFKLKDSTGTTKRAKLPLYGAPDWTTTNKYVFDNTDDYLLSETTAEEFGLTGTAFTIHMIINFDMAGTDQAYLFSFFDGTATGKVELFRINSAFRFNVGSGYTAATPTRADKDYHLVMVYDGSLATDILRAKIYVDGADATVVGSGTIPSTAPVGILDQKMGVAQRYTPVVGQYYDGGILEMSIYNKALSSAEVTTLYNSGSYSDPTAISGCVSSWWFGDNPSDGVTRVVDNEGFSDLYGQNLDDGIVTSV